MGVRRILTSGQKNKAIDGIPLIAELVKAAGNDLKIMVGSGVFEENILEIAQKTQAKAFHVSLRESYKSAMNFRREDVYMGGLKDVPEYANKHTSVERVEALITKLEEFYKKGLSKKYNIQHDGKSSKSDFLDSPSLNYKFK